MKISSLRRSLLAVAIFSFATVAWAAPDDGAEQQDGMTVEQFVDSLHFKEGHVEVPEAKAHFDLGPDFQFLGKKDTRRVLEDFWGNPPDDTVLGMIVPRHPALDEEGNWAVVVTYSDDGYISDDDAAKIDYDELLANLKKETDEDNAARAKQGYGTVDLVGWAVPPRYDANSKKLYWAKELKFSDSDGNTLNYDIRVLGRNGYVSLNAISGMDELPQVRDGMQKLLPMAEFDDGARYADYNEDTDKVAGYGLAALIGGGIAAKAGLLTKLGLLLAKGWKLLIIGFVALAGVVRKLFGGKKGDSKEDSTVQ